MIITKAFRRKMKQQQKQHVTQNLAKCVGAWVAAYLPVLLIMVLGYALFYMLGYVDFFSEQSNTANSMMQAYRTMHVMGQFVGIYLLLIVLYIVVAAPLQMGLMEFYIQLSRGKNPSVSYVFHPFSSIRTIWRAIRMQFCLGFRGFLWMFVPNMVYNIMVSSSMVGITMQTQTTSSAASVAMIAILTILYGIIAILVSVRIFLYKAGYLICMENKRIGVWNATTLADFMFRGKYKSMLAWMLSFLPWILALYGIALLGMIIMIFSNMIGILFLLLLIIADSIIGGSFLMAYVYTSFFGIFDSLDPNEELLMPSPLMQTPQNPQAQQKDTQKFDTVLHNGMFTQEPQEKPASSEPSEENKTSSDTGDDTNKNP